jgi:type IV pilus assembly protein PilO
MRVKIKREHIYLVAFVVLLIGAVSFFFGKPYASVRQEVSGLKTKIEVKQRDLEGLRKVAQSLDLLAREERILRRELEVYKGMLPRREEIPSLLRKVTTCCNRNQVHVRIFTPKAHIEKELYREIPIYLSVEATYHGLGKFLSDIAALPRIVKPAVDLIRERTPTPEHPMTVSAELLLKTYVYKER